MTLADIIVSLMLDKPEALWFIGTAATPRPLIRLPPNQTAKQDEKRKPETYPDHSTNPPHKVGSNDCTASSEEDEQEKFDQGHLKRLRTD